MSPELVRTYSHVVVKKPRNYNGTVLFLRLIIIMKFLPNQLKSLSNMIFFHKYFGCLICFCLHWKLLSATADFTRKEVTFWFWHWQKCEFWIDWVRLFHAINLKNNDAIVMPRFSTQYVVKFGRVLVTYVKTLLRHIQGVIIASKKQSKSHGYKGCHQRIIQSSKRPRNFGSWNYKWELFQLFLRSYENRKRQRSFRYHSYIS